MKKEKIIQRLLKFAESFDSKNWELMSDCLAENIYTDYSSFRKTQPCFIFKEEYIQLRKIGLKSLHTKHLFKNFEFDFSAQEINCHCEFSIYRFTKNFEKFYHSYGTYIFGLTGKEKNLKVEKIVQIVQKNEGDRNIHGAFQN